MELASEIGTHVEGSLGDEWTATTTRHHRDDTSDDCETVYQLCQSVAKFPGPSWHSALSGNILS